jgi:long-chain acyl-CoA synthetase
MSETRPWLRFYRGIPATIDYTRGTMYELLRRSGERHPHVVAWELMGSKATYSQMLAEIDHCASGLAALGLKKGDRVTIALPNTPHALVCFYALNKLGVVASMIHPLSAPPEIEAYLKTSESVGAITLDMFYGKFRDVLARTPTRRVVVCRVSDYLGAAQRIGFAVTAGRKIAPVPADPEVLLWRDLMSRRDPVAPVTSAFDPDELAVILYSGGTTGQPKGIMLSNMNFNCLSQQTLAHEGLRPGESMLAILPMFHGFGLGVCIHTILVGGGRCLLVPRFTPEAVGKIIRRRQPALIAGVPTLFEALAQNKDFQASKLDCLRAAYSGGDRLPRAVKERFDEVVRKRGGSIGLREGYGLTESVTVCMLMPKEEYRENSIGIPYPDMVAKVVDRETLIECPAGVDGEICIRGPTVMMGYLDDPEETARTLRHHSDGAVWLHTGDVGSMDADGFFYFKHRAKRMVKVSGVSVYPNQVEDVLNAHPDVAVSCAIGVPDPQKMQRVKAFVVLKDRSRAGPAMRQHLLDHCKNNLNTWSCPREIEFRGELPKTRIGKVAYTVLEQEESIRPSPCPS